jgi:hypothetical protein
MAGNLESHIRTSDVRTRYTARWGAAHALEKTDHQDSLPVGAAIRAAQVCSDIRGEVIVSAELDGLMDRT